MVSITWTGPNGPGDYITFAPAGSPAGTYLGYAYTTGGSPASVQAPADAGDYEIRYVAGTKATLKAIPVRVN
jgi:Ca-activated chloride channel family protein